jgi:micrococcal nuclease
MNNLLLLLFACLTLQLSPRHVMRVIDGDTGVLFHVGIPAEERFRVLNIDTPERGQPGFEEAKAFTENWLAQGNFTLTACKRDSFGRLLAIVSREGVTLADALYNAGLGTRP